MSRHGDNIFRRKDKRWEGRYICGRTEDGRARYKSVYAHSYAECRQKLDAHQMATELRGRRMTVSQLFEIWLESRKNSVKLSTYTNYRTLYTNHIKSVLGGLPCESITAEMLNKYVSSLTESGNIFGGEFSANSVLAYWIEYTETNCENRRRNCGRHFLSALLGSLGCYFKVYIRGFTGRFHYARLDEGRTRDDYLLLRRNKTSYFQNRAVGL